MKITILDLETTGLNAQYGHQIIEIGILKGTLQNGRIEIEDEFESLVNPGSEIDEKISYITGIKNSDLVNAPQLESIRDRIASFFSPETIIVGHNIGFDVGFLEKAGFKLPSRLLDTLDLAFLFEPNNVSLSLESLAARYDIAHRSHRAMGDVLATKEIFEKFVHKTKEIPREAQGLINFFIHRSDWSGKELFEKGPEQELDMLFTPYMSAIQKRLEQNKEKPAGVSTIHNKELYTTLSGLLAKNHPSIVNIPPNSAKTSTALLAAYDFSTQNHTRVLYLTPFITSDIKKCVSEIDHHGEIQIFCDPEGFVSLGKIHDLLEKENAPNKDTTVFLIKMVLWLNETVTGHIREINFPGQLWAMGSAVCGRGGASTHDNIEELFQHNHRNEQEHSRVLIATFRDLFRHENKKYFDVFEHRIVEQAATLEEQLLYLATTVVSVNRLGSLFQRFDLLASGQPQPRLDILSSLQTAQNSISFFFAYLGILAQKLLREENREVILPANMSGNPDFQKVRDSATTLIESINILSEIAIHDSSLIQEAERMKRVLTMIQDPAAKKDQNTLFFLEIRHDEEVVIKYARTDIEALFHEAFGHKKNIILLSSPVMPLQKQLGLDDFERIDLRRTETSATNYFLANDLSVDSSYGYIKKLSELSRRMLVSQPHDIIFLVSSASIIEQLALFLTPYCKENSIELLAQKISGSDLKILQKYEKSGFRAPLLCTVDFFLKLDPRTLPTTQIILQKLPFVFTNGLIDQERKKKYANAFMDYALPRTLLKFSEIIGQIEKIPAENKQAYILDNKIVVQQYGKYFREVLPEEAEIAMVPENAIGV